MKVAIIFHSLYGHTYALARAVAEGAREVAGAEVELYRISETLADEVLKKMGAAETTKKFAHVPVATMDDLASADAVIFGTPTRFGMMTAEMRAFLDATGKLWSNGALVGKVGSVFTSTATQHGGQETTITSFHATLLHHGMVVVGVPYAEKGLSYVGAMSGGSPYGASTITCPDGSRMPSENELAIARFQGRHVAGIADKLFGRAR